MPRRIPRVVNNSTNENNNHNLPVYNNNNLYASTRRMIRSPYSPTAPQWTVPPSPTYTPLGTPTSPSYAPTSPTYAPTSPTLTAPILNRNMKMAIAESLVPQKSWMRMSRQMRENMSHVPRPYRRMSQEMKKNLRPRYNNSFFAHHEDPISLNTIPNEYKIRIPIKRNGKENLERFYDARFLFKMLQSGQNFWPENKEQIPLTSWPSIVNGAFAAPIFIKKHPTRAIGRKVARFPATRPHHEKHPTRVIGRKVARGRPHKKKKKEKTKNR